MNYLISGGIAFVIITIITGKVYKECSNDFVITLGLFFACSILVSIIIWLIITCCSFRWVSAGYKAEIINREYNTNYTQQEIFYAADIIDKIREIDRKRVELNGNIINK